MDLKSLLLENRGIKQTIFKNTFWLAVAEGITKGVVFLVAVWLARHFGPATYGRWTFALSFVSIFAILADFGFGTLTVREIARDKSKSAQYIDNIIGMKLILGLITLGLIAFIIQFLGKELEVVKLVYFLGIYTVLDTFAIFFQSIFRAYEKMQYETACRGLQSLSLLVLIAFFILKEGSILTISYAYLGAALIGIVFSLGTIRCCFSKFFIKIDFKICKIILKEVLPFALSGLIVTSYLKIGVILLSLMKTDQAVGWYNAAFSLVYNLAFIPNLLMISVYPNLSLCYKESPQRFQKIYKMSLKFILLISIILFPILFIFSAPIILLLYNSAYIETILVFRIIIWAEFFSFMSCVFMYILNAVNKQVLYTKVVGICLAVNIILCFILIPKYSYIGLSIITLITEFLAFSLLFLYTRQNINKLKEAKL